MVDPSLLVCLPASFGRLIVSEWLRSDAVARLDIAYCSRAERKMFLDFVSGSVVSGNRNIALEFQSCLRRIPWASSRNVRISSFLCSWIEAEVPDVAVLDAYFAANSNTLKRVSICGDDTAVPEKFNAAISSILSHTTDVLVDLCLLIPVQWEISLPAGICLSVLHTIHISTISEMNLICVCKAAPNLVEIELDHPYCSGSGLAAIGQHCSSVEIFRIWQTGDVVNLDQGISAIAKGCKKLRRLELLCEWDNFTDIGLAAVARYCTQLETLIVTDDESITDAPLIALANSSNATTLRTVGLCGNTNIVGPGILAIAKNCTALDKLNLGSLVQIEAFCICGIIPLLKNVVEFSLFRHQVYDAMLELIAEHMPLLEDLDIVPDDEPHFTKKALLHIALKCKKLRRLELGRNHPLTDMEISLWKELRPGLEIITTT